MTRPRPQGFTLIETIFSTLFIGITILAILNLFPGAYLSIKKSETQLQADFIAKSVMDDLRLTRFSDLEPGMYSKSEAPYEPWIVDGVTYTPKVFIYEVPNTHPDFLKGVRVTIDYRVGLFSKEVVHETYLHKLIR